jgi:hypothetical protein
MPILEETFRLATTPARIGFRVADRAVRTALHVAGALREAAPDGQAAPAPPDRPAHAFEPEPPELDPRDTVAPVDPGPLEPAEPARAPVAPPAATAVADPGEELVGEFGEEGADEAPGADVHVDPPFEGYASLKVGEVRDRLQAADREEVAAVLLYERFGQGRRGVLDAAERRLARLDASSA